MRLAFQACGFVIVRALDQKSLCSSLQPRSKLHGFYFQNKLNLLWATEAACTFSRAHP